MTDDETMTAAWHEEVKRFDGVLDAADHAWFEAGWRAAQPGEDSSTHIVWAGELMDMRDRGEKLASALRLSIAPHAGSERDFYDHLQTVIAAARAALADWDALSVPSTPRETAP